MKRFFWLLFDSFDEVFFWWRRYLFSDVHPLTRQEYHDKFWEFINDWDIDWYNAEAKKFDGYWLEWYHYKPLWGKHQIKVFVVKEGERFQSLCFQKHCDYSEYLKITADIHQHEQVPIDYWYLPSSFVT